MNKMKQNIKKKSVVFSKLLRKFLNEASQYLRSTSMSRMSIKEQTFFIKRLSFLIKAGVPMLESLVMIRDQTRKKNYVNIFNTIIIDVSNGQYLSTSLSKFIHIFGEFSINIIYFGESTGILGDNLVYLAEELKKKNALRKKILSAFIYPVIVILATLCIIGFLMIYLFPKIMPVFLNLHIKLPISTRLVIFFSNTLIHHWFLLIFIFISFFVVLFMVFKKSLRFRFYFDKVITKLPKIGNLVKYYNLANSTRTMGLLLKSGVTLSDTLDITAKISKNLVYKEEFKAMSKEINRGEQISTHFIKNTDLFPDVLAQIIYVGERTGNLSNSLIYVSELYESEVDEFTKNINTLIEPALMILAGILVGFIAISIITPIYSITQNLHG